VAADAARPVVSLGGEAGIGVLTEGYAFGQHRFTRYDVDAFRMRLLGRPTVFLRGIDAARFFYGPDRFDRTALVPRTVLHSLQDEGSVQTLAGAAHLERKAMFVETAGTLEAEEALTELFAERLDVEWRRRSGEQVSVLFLLSRTLTAVALDWLGLPYDEAALQARTQEFAAMIDGAGSFGPRNVYGRALRLRTERWALELVHRMRGGESVGGSLAAHVVARTHADDPVAAIELLNLLRPVVAVARFGMFAVLALHRQPDWRERLLTDDADGRAFAQEVRRTAPFFPLIGGTATRDLEWEGLHWNRGDRVIVDLFATNRSPRLWADPERFDPDRFARGEDDENIVAQGAGLMSEGHRCPGEPATVRLIEVIAREFAERRWSVPNQDLRVDLRRLPAQPGRQGVLVTLG
jgi:fatty-acid peroxygenase